MPKLEFAGTIAISFAIGNLVKLPAYWAIGQLDGLNWGLIAGLAASGIAGTYAGRYLTSILSEAVYIKVIQVMLFILSILLLIRGGIEAFSG